MKIIYRAGDITEAHIILGLLNANGIEAHVGGLYLQGGIGDLAVSDFVNVHVANADVALAKSIISEYEGIKHKPEQTTKTHKTTLVSRLSITLLACTLMIFIYFLVSS